MSANLVESREAMARAMVELHQFHKANLDPVSFQVAQKIVAKYAEAAAAYSREFGRADRAARRMVVVPRFLTDGMLKVMAAESDPVLAWQAVLMEAGALE